MSKTQAAAPWFVGAIGMNESEELSQVVSSDPFRIQYDTLVQVDLECPPAWFHPIPLTPEIMEVLGFRVVDNDHAPNSFFLLYKGSRNLISLDPDRLDPKYLHELQYDWLFRLREPLPIDLQKLQEVVK